MNYIKNFKYFIKEELTTLKKNSRSGYVTQNIKIFNDVNPNIKSQSSLLLLNNDLRNNEIEEILKKINYNLDIDYNSIDTSLLDKDTLQKLFLKNNTEFLRSELKKNKVLLCEYCNDDHKKPLYLYDVLPTKETINLFKNNKYYIPNGKFKSKNGATCDHKQPKSKGGKLFNYDNLAVCCYRCNKIKGDKDYNEWLQIINK